MTKVKTGLFELAQKISLNQTIGYMNFFGCFKKTCLFMHYL